MSYKDKVLALTQLHDFKPGLHSIRIAHDNWCSIYSGSGECNCDPDVSLESSSPNMDDHAKIFTSCARGMQIGHERYKKIGRNEPCPCGSGIKFKHCHGAVGGFAA
jgi:hypothetical protein